MPFFMSAIFVWYSVLSHRAPGRAENSFLWGSNWAVWGWSDSLTPMGSNCHRMETFLGRIVTVSDGAGRSVTVSKQGLD